MRTYEPTSKVISVVNSVDIDGKEKYLVVSTHIVIVMRSDNCWRR
jgi:hypothetical protein